jgi:hypothetical protein
MAPIPLTLLGIIPAHMLFFQMGWGGEFTATSMIGWIALAGIIVRNSILLVDFSVHRIQQGDSVVDAVINACKTRTRPILITALALVAGSSVIFFDPIFQGMAISLASGVLVSTLLTLVVIPLGCVAAADALCSVAGSTKCRKFPRGMGPDDDPDGNGGPSGGRPRVGDPLWVKAWGGFASVMFAVIGVVAMLVSAVAGLLKRKSKPTPVARAAAAPKPSAKPSARAVASSDASRARDEARTAAAVSEPATVESSDSPAPAAGSGVEPDAAMEAAAPAKKPATAEAVTTKPTAKKASAKKAPAKKAAVKKAAARKKPVSKAAAKKTVTKKVTKAESRKAELKIVPPPVARAESGEKSDTSPTDDAAAKSAGRKKASGRRGIQLKSLGKTGGDGLN